MRAGRIFGTTGRIVALAVWLVSTGWAAADVDKTRPWAYLYVDDKLDKPFVDAPVLTLRANAKQPLYLYVVNPTKEASSVNVELLAGSTPIGKVAAKRLELNQAQQLMAPVPVAVPAPPPTDGKPAAASGAALPVVNVDGKARLKVRLAVSNTNKPDEAPNVTEQLIEIANPAAFVNVKSIKVTGNDNRLEVILEPKELKGGDMPVEVTFAADNPADLDRSEIQGVLKGTLRADQKELVLYSKPLNTRGEVPGIVSLTLDGIENAKVYTGKFNAQKGLSEEFNVKTAKTVIITAPRFARPGADVTAKVVLDDVALDGVLTFQVLHEGTVPGQTVTHSVSRDYRATAQVDEGVVVVTTVAQPWLIKLNTAGVYGLCVLKADVTSSGRPVGSGEAQIIFDDSGPKEVAIVAADPKQLSIKARKYSVRAVAEDAESGITNVEFFVGVEPPPPSTDPKAPAGPKPFLGVADPYVPGTWVTTFVLPEKPGPVPVFVRVTNGVGMSEVKQAEILVIDPPLGAIKGRATFDGTPQITQVRVWLLDKDLKPVKAEVTVDKKSGYFEFKDVTPGDYRVVSEQRVSGRKRIGQTPVTVTEGPNPTETTIKLKAT